MEITRSGSPPSTEGPVEYFTGRVRIDPFFQTTDPADALAAHVTFEPCSRTAGMRIRRARFSSSPRAVVTYRVGEDQSSKFGLATASGAHRVKNNGMAPPRLQP